MGGERNKSRNLGKETRVIRDVIIEKAAQVISAISIMVFNRVKIIAVM